MASITTEIVSIQLPDKCTIRITLSNLTYETLKWDTTRTFVIWRYSIQNKELVDSQGIPIYFPEFEPNVSSATRTLSNIPISVVSGKSIGFSLWVSDKSGYYNQAYGYYDTYISPVYIPTIPSSISYPSSINSALSARVSWGTSTGNGITYVLERSINNGAFSQLYSGTLTYHTDMGISSSDTKVQYRVKATAALASSDYKTGGISTVYYNPPPGIPANLTVPTAIRGGQVISISWGIASDNNLSGYTLERAINSGAFGQVYKGSNRSYADTAGANWNTVQYRVRAYDTYNATGGYRTGDVINVVQNTPPIISGSDINLGVKTGAFNQAYTVTDADAGQTITVAEKIDGKQKRSFTATSGTQYTVSITAAEWLETLNGAHTITITATDNYGSAATRTYTFSKNETAIEIQLATPLVADDRIVRAIMSIVRILPESAIFTVEVCNNGNDVAPTWIDVTSAVLSGSKFFFGNTVKTAATWGFDFRIKVQRNGAAGDCYIQGVWGNFE